MKNKFDAVVVGGAPVSGEFHPGYRNSIASGAVEDAMTEGAFRAAHLAIKALISC